MIWSRGKAYSQDLRERVFALSDEGGAVGQIAKRLCVSVSYVSKVLGRRRMTGETAARAQRCHVPLKLGDLHTAIAAEVTANPDTTIAELRQWLAKTHTVTASQGVVFKALAQLGLTHKKRPFMRPSRSGPMLPPRVRNGGQHSPSLQRTS